MKRELVIRPEAEAELREAFDWYEERVQGLGSEFLISVDATIHALSRKPQQFAKVHKPYVEPFFAAFHLQCTFWLKTHAS